MTIKEYLKSIDYDLIKKMDDALTLKGLSKNEKPMILSELSKEKDSSLVASYYISLCYMDFDIEHSNIKSVRSLEGAGGNVFTDYQILKNRLNSAGKELVERVNYYTLLSPVIGALKELSTTLNEAKFLYADSLSSDLRALRDIDKAYKLFSELYSIGHVSASLELGRLIYTESSLKSHHKEIISILEYAYNHGAYYAAYILYNIYLKGFYTIKPDSNLSTKWKALYDEYKETIEYIDSNVQIVSQDTLDEEKNTEEEPFDLYKEYEIAIKANDNYESLFALLERIKDTEPLFYYSESIRTYIKLGQIDKALKYVPGFEKYLTPKVKENHKNEIIEIYKSLSLYDKVSALEDNPENLSLSEVREKAHEAEKNNDTSLMIKYYNLCILLKDYSYYYKLYSLMVKLNDYDKAIEYLKDGASLDNLICEKVLASHYLNGEIVKKDINEAVRLLMSAYKKGDLYSAFKLGYLLYEGKYVFQDKEKGLELMNKAINSGYNDKTGDYSLVYFSLEKEKEAISYLENKISEFESEDASIKLADYYFKNKRYFKAKEYYLIASKYNNPRAFYHLGLIYKDGLCKVVNAEKAYNYFINANMFDYSNSEYQIGVCAYLLKKYEESYRYLRDSLSLDNPYAYYILSELHYRRLIKGHNMDDAIAYAKVARKYGYAPSVREKRN